MTIALICLAIYFLLAGFTLVFRQDLVWSFQQRRRGGLRASDPDPNWQSNMTLIGIAGFGLGFALILYLVLA